MEVFRCKQIFVIIVIFNIPSHESSTNNESTTESTSHNCPFTKIIEDMFKIHNKTSKNGIYLRDAEKAKLFLNTLTNYTNIPNNKTVEEQLINGIIETINKIKNNLTSEGEEETKLNEAIIITQNANNVRKTVSQIKSGIEEKNDDYKPKLDNSTTNTQKDNYNIGDNVKPTTDKTKYVEILTIEPNTTTNSTSNNIIEVLKHIMPMFNNTDTKELHSITIIERNHNKNHSFVETKNISTVVVKYCDKNVTKFNDTVNNDEVKSSLNDTLFDYYGERDIDYDFDDKIDVNIPGDNKVLEAAEYGMQKMHELYTVLEPKLYSMGLWLNEKDPARYVAAFNAPSEDVARYSRYGYAAIQAATKLRQLTSEANDGLESRTEGAQFPSASALRQSPLLEHCPLRGPPKCPPASKRYRTHDGTCNNLSRLRWGSTMTPVQRFLQPVYSDGIQAPRRSVFGSPLPSAREISSHIHEDRNVESQGVTHLLMQWGQFLDHDVVSSSQSRGFNGSVPRCCKDGGRDFIPKELLHPECLPIAVPTTDPFYGPRKVKCLDFVRSSPAPRDDCAIGWREQMNQVSAYIDGSPLYASNARQSDKLRLFRNGMLQYGRVQQRRPLLPPERRDEMCRGGAVSADCFRSGDARVNEHPGLVAAHIVWLRQHNRMAQELAHLNPHWSDEKIYQETRKIVGAMVQHITYREFLPVVLGTEVMRLFELEPQKKGFFKSYDPKVNPSPASSFASAAFRFGHSLVQPSMVRFDRFHRPMANNVSLHDELTNPSNIWSMGAVDRLLLGMVNQPIQKRDEFITEELTNHLFQTPHFDFGMDLAAINIQRGRDHGVPPYTAWREPCGLTTLGQFEDLFRVMPARVVRKLKVLYRHVDDIDLFTGGMAERPVVGGLVGPTFACIIAQQFANLKKGDRFWYENGGFESSFTPAQLQQIRRISLAQVLCRTLDTIDSVQPFVFLAPDSPDNERISCFNGLLNNFDLSPWVEINSDSNNDIRKSDEEPTTQKLKPTTQKLRRTKPTTTRPGTTKRPQQTAASNKVSQKKPPPTNSTKTSKLERLNNTETALSLDSAETHKPNLTIKIDDKLDFRNKSRRYDFDNTNTRYTKPTNQYNDYDDDVHSVQSLVINNVPHKRPYSRPFISVTENIDKYTYLINYVPRPTQSWRQTTRRNQDRDVVKVTYQSYDDTYRRPNRPYYNRHDEDDIDSRNNKPSQVTDTLLSSARSNDEELTVKPELMTNRLKEMSLIETLNAQLTERPEQLTKDVPDKVDATTEQLHKLMTFGYVGTYRGDMTDTHNTDKTDKTDEMDEKSDIISKDFNTYETKKTDSLTDESPNTEKLSTFVLYDTATKPYNDRPTRRNDDEQLTNTHKYYYVRNVLHKYPDSMSEKEFEKHKEQILRENYNNPGLPSINVEERSVSDKMAFLEEDAKANEQIRSNVKKPTGPAKTPSVEFQIIPSEISPTQWAVYEEKDDLENVPHQMPSIKVDPNALRETPRPINFSSIRRKPGRI